MLRLRTPVVLVCLWMTACAEPEGDPAPRSVRRSLASNGFIDAGTMSTNRRFFTMTSLGNGDWLLTGGGFPTGTSSVDVYSAYSGELRPGPTLPSPRGRHTATFLHEGRVLVTGGDPGTGPARDTLFFDPRTNSWTPGPELLTGRAQHTATLLPDGRLLVTGGFDDAGVALASAEVFDPIARTWSGVGPMMRPREQHTATLLPDGRVLVVGGDSTSVSAIADADLFDPDAGTFTPTTPMTVERRRHTATLLFDGRVLITGGRNSTSTALNSAQLYDPRDAGWSALLTMPSAQYSATAALLPDGRVLIAGGSDGTNPLNTTAFFAEDAGGFVSGPPLIEFRSELSSVVLPAGDVIVCGGTSAASAARTCERISPQTDSLVSAPQPVARTYHFQQLLLDGSVLIAGGQNGSTQVAAVQRLAPGATSWTDAGLMPQPRSRARHVALGDGRTLLVSGLVGGVSVPIAEILDPLTESWTSLPDLPDAGTVSLYNFGGDQLGLDLGDRGAMYAFDWVTNTFVPTTQLPTARNGRFMCLLAGRLFTGGGALGSGTSSALVHLYDATSRSWTAMPSLPSPRQDARCEVLPDGRLLIFGGRNSGTLLTTAELFSFDAGWSPTGSLNFGRYDAETVMLPSGRVLVHGGTSSDGGTVSDTEIYDPAAGRFFPAPNSPVAQAGERLTLMPDGRVLIGRLGTWRFYDEGRGQQPAWTPSLSAPGAVEPGATVRLLSPSLLTGGSERSSGNSSNEAASPLVVLQERNIDRFRYLPVLAWDSSSVTVRFPQDVFQGVHYLILVVAGVRSDAVPVRVALPGGSSCIADWECSSSACRGGACVARDAGTPDGGLDAGTAEGDAGLSPDAGTEELRRVQLDVGCGCSEAPALAAPLLFLLTLRRRRRLKMYR